MSWPMLGPARWAYLCVGPTDMRKSFNTLAALVQHHMGRDPLSGELFAFCSKRRNLIKVLVFDGTGLWVHAKRLEQGTFAWPTMGGPSQSLTSQELDLILQGIDAKEVKSRRWYRRDSVAL